MMHYLVLHPSIFYILMSLFRSPLKKKIAFYILIQSKYRSGLEILCAGLCVRVQERERDIREIDN